MHLAAERAGKDTRRVVPSASCHQHRDKRTPLPLDRRKPLPPWPPTNCQYRSNQQGNDPSPHVTPTDVPTTLPPRSPCATACRCEPCWGACT
ncbi:hypothetical protein E2562_021461 [Oryza meyeriana var. granulata]|uniref:Uncharacterized protein n=1 Tax=Oryza meyeriana var. granulata TaxID=110450 RepID=A0A6G1C856_9ORYZ|nr:hypothetical protein E2562_021461 [Oryza meyeriana var. granulata]